MPRKHKGKGRSRTKRQNVKERSQNLDVAHSTTTKEEATFSTGQRDSPSSPNSSTHQAIQTNAASISDDLSVFSTGAVGGEASGINAASVSDDLSVFSTDAVGGEASGINAASVSDFLSVFSTGAVGGEASGINAASVSDDLSVFLTCTVDGEASGINAASVSDFLSLFSTGDVGGEPSGINVSSLSDDLSVFSIDAVGDEVSDINAASVSDDLSVFLTCTVDGEASGINAASVSDFLSVFSTGAVGGEASGINATSVSDDLSVFSTGAVGGEASGINAASVSDDLSVFSTGAVGGEASGINAASVSDDLSVFSTGAVGGEASGINAASVSDDLSVFSTGAVGGEASGINAASVSDDLSVFSTGAVRRETSGINAASVSDFLSVFSAGAVGGETSGMNANPSVRSSRRRSGTLMIGSTTHSARRNPINRKASVLMEFMLEKFKLKEHFTQKEMAKVINRKYKAHFPEIIKRISVHLELVFGLELKEVDPTSQSYTLVGMLGLSTEGNLRNSTGLPKTGLLMTLLAVIFMNGNISTEEDIWEFLKVVGIYPGRDHPIFGEPKEFITKDLVRENYLEYHRVSGSDPPKYVLLWGSRAYAETTKMKVLEVLAKFNDAIPSSFPSLYEEALFDEANRAARRVTTVPGNARDSPHVGYITHNLSFV